MSVDTDRQAIDDNTGGLMTLLQTAHRQWQWQHDGDVPDLLLIGVTKGSMIPTSPFTPSPEALREVARGLAKTADAIEAGEV